jgi:uncharacterized membrane protein
MPITDERQRIIHEAFEVGIVLKGLNAILEVVFGILLLFTNVLGLVHLLIADALIEDPDNFFAMHLRVLANPSHAAQVYGGLYLLGHGIVKIVLVAGLLRKKAWAYPASIAVLSLFILYEAVQFLHTHSMWLFALTIFDLALVWLVWQEYRRISHRRSEGMVS